jgi:hypothetical protein
MTPADVLRTVPAYLGKHGWVQGHFTNGEGACCLVQAIENISIDNLLIYETRMAFSAVHGYTCAYNDTPGRTLEEVKTACLQAADAWEATQ